MRRRNQPAPPHVLFGALIDPDRDPARRWLRLLDDERRPEVVAAAEPHLVVWSSPWDRRPDARSRFELPWYRSGHSTDLRWALLVEEPLHDPSLLGHLRHRVNRLVNADLRYSLGY